MASNRILKDHEPGCQPSSRLVGKVVLMIGQLGIGGTEKQIVLLSRGLHDRGIDTSVWVLFGGARNYEEALQQTGIRVVHVGLRRFREVRSAFLNIARLGGMVMRLRRERPDIVHAFLFHAYVVAAPVVRLAGIRAFVAGRRSLGNFKKGHPMLMAVERLATSITDLLIANAAAIADDTKLSERVANDKIKIIYNGLPKQAFARVPPSVIGTRNPVVLCVANLKPCKGHSHLLEALSLLQGKGRPCTLVLAGEGGERHALECRAARLGIDARFLGECEDVRSLLARADVVAHPSLEEGMSNAVMEAMAAGRAVVATNVGGTPELLRGRGLLVPPADPVALADAIQQVLDDRVLARRLGESARRWTHEHLSAGAMVDRHIQIYSELLERRCAG
jgi:glycosyltransferase involved in cell wall biosynthesis